MKQRGALDKVHKQLITGELKVPIGETVVLSFAKLCMF